MNEQETMKFLGLITAAYPERFMLHEYSPDIWGELLHDLTFEDAVIALKCHIASSHYVPTIADIRRLVAERHTDPHNQIDAGAAWDLVLTAVGNYGVQRKQQALESLPTRTQQAARYIGWETICMSDRPDIVRSQFVKAYQEIIANTKQQAMLPKSLQSLVQQTVKAIE